MTPLLLDLAIIRLIEPASKLRSVELLSRYFEIKYSQRIYRTIPKLISWKAEIEQRVYSVARQKFKEQFYVFAGNTFEGKTMLPVVEGFIAKHPDTKPIVVADAAMLDDDRLAELREKGLSYIVGARLANTDLGTVKKIHGTLNAVNGAGTPVVPKRISRVTAKDATWRCSIMVDFRVGSEYKF